MINETITNIPTFEQATAVTSSVPFIIFLITSSILILLVYIIWASLTKAKTSSGKAIQNTSVIQSTNFWLSFLLLFFMLTIFVLLIIFPVWFIPLDSWLN